jgi:hypothetical protein
VSKYIIGETNAINTTSGVECLRAKLHLDKLQTNSAFVRNGKLFNTLILGLCAHISTEDLLEYDTIYYCDCDHLESAITKQHKHRYTIGDNGSKIFSLPDCCVGVTIFTIGPVRIKKVVKTQTYKTNWDNNHIRGLREFSMSQAGLPNVIIPDVLLRKLLTRAMVEKVNITDMLSYCRSIASTVIYTSAGYYRRYKSDLDQMGMYCMVAINIADRHRKFFTTIQLAMENRADNSIMNQIQSIVKSTISSHLMSFISEHQVGELISSYKEFVTESKRVPSILTDLVNMFKDKHVVEMKPTVKFSLIHEASKSGSSHKNSRNPSDDDQSDSDLTDASTDLNEFIAKKQIQ